MNIALIAIAAVVMTCTLEGAGPVTHAYLADRYMNHFDCYSDSERSEFMVGTLFPDIRYLGTIPREKTHYATISLKEIIDDPSPFMAGVKFHSYVDNIRNKMVVSKQVYKWLPAGVQNKMQHTFLKLVEDELIYHGKKWGHCCLSLEKIYPEELKMGVDKNTALKWHTVLTLFFHLSPASILTFLTFIDLGIASITPDDAKSWVAELQPALSEAHIHLYINELIEHFDKEYAKITVGSI